MPPVEAWEKVLIKLGTKANPGELDQHMATMTCEQCHGGDATALDDPEAAHVGLIADPSAPATNACKQCHPEVAATYWQSMHATLQGETNSIAARAGHATFEQCPQALQTGFKGECTKCHATCGDCHISRPNANGKGFIKSHVFNQKPSQAYQCLACHGARIGYDYLGSDDEGRAPDVHFSKGMSCMSCHGQVQAHQAAGEAFDRYHVANTPRCEHCHAVSTANAYHQQHWNDLSCHVCHSVAEYQNCAGCHTSGVYTTDPVYQADNPFQAFRVGRNPFPDRRFAFVTVRHAPVVPDTYAPWGADPLAAFDALPTWKYTTPHNVRRWTPRTQVAAGAHCASACHLGEPGGSDANADLYLWRDFVDAGWPVEAGANESVIVDGALPASWEAAPTTSPQP